MTEPEPGSVGDPDADFRAYKCEIASCKDFGIEVRRSEKDPKCSSCGLFLHELMLDSADEQRFAENVNPTYEDGFRHGVDAGKATGWTAEDFAIVEKHPELKSWVEAKIEGLRERDATIQGYRDMIREASATAGEAVSETKAVETQRSELLRLLRDFKPDWLNIGVPPLGGPEWRTRFSLLMDIYRNFPAPNIIRASAIVHGKGGAKA